MLLMQTGGDWVNTLFWFILFALLAFLYPKMLISQMLLRLGRTAMLLDSLTLKGKEIILRKISSRPDKKLRKKVSSFLDFFLIQPVNLDPFGIVKKFEHLINLEDKRFKSFISKIATNLDEERKASLISALSAEMSLHQTTKLIKHYIELIKKTKSYQLGLLIQMQLPLIEKASKALFKGVEALSNSWPIGDSIGPLVAAKLIKGKIRELKDEEVVYCERKLAGKKVYVLKAKGPGARVGKLGRAVEKLMKKHKISKIITVDAALKLESETTGSVAEGVGVAIGGIGVEKAQIENIAVKKSLPLDSYVIKMNQEEAIMPMKSEILRAADLVIEKIKENVSESKDGVLIVGVGNTSGIPNNSDLKETISLILANDKKLKEWIKEEEKKEKESGFFFPFGF